MSQISENPEITVFVESENEKLRAAGVESAEQAFGIGCGIGLLPTVIIVIVLFAFNVISFILAIILLLMGLLAVVGISMLLASRARVNAEAKTYDASVEPEILQYLEEVGVTQQQFVETVQEQLLDNAPLRVHLERAGKI